MKYKFFIIFLLLCLSGCKKESVPLETNLIIGQWGLYCVNNHLAYVSGSYDSIVLKAEDWQAPEGADWKNPIDNTKTLCPVCNTNLFAGGRIQDLAE